MYAVVYVVVTVRVRSTARTTSSVHSSRCLGSYLDPWILTQVMFLGIPRWLSMTRDTDVNDHEHAHGLDDGSLHGVLTSFMQWRGIGNHGSMSTTTVESPKGELSVSVVLSATRLWRCRLRPADLHHLLSLQSTLASWDTMLARVVS